MKAAIVAVGSELLRFGRTDGNGDWLQARLAEIGIETALRSRVEDDAARIAALVRSALDGHEIVLVSGGLGPTEDDRTREGLARAIAVPLERDPAALRTIGERLRARGLPLTAAQSRQADRPCGADWIDNPLGSAPGLFLRLAGGWLVALPGVPGEMVAMFRTGVLPALLERSRPAIARRSFAIAGLPESVVDERVRELYGVPGVDVTLLGGPEGVGLDLRCCAASGEAAERRLEELERWVRERFGLALVGDGEETLAVAVGRLLAAAGKTLATAESCTAGLLASTIAAVAGCSAWYRGGLIPYADDLKCGLAGVRAETLADHGAVSEAVARELAFGARERCGADIGIGVSGIAGPGGGSPAKPVGRIHVALQYGDETHHDRHDFGGDRETVRRRAVAAALDRLRRRLLAPQ